MLQLASRLLPLPALARLTGRSWWALSYADGRTVEEPSCDWGAAPYAGRRALRLYCPNGEVAELGNETDATGRLFQLKQAVIGAGAPKRQLCHLIGLVADPSGRCICAAWEYEGNGRLVRFEDNALGMRYGQIGRLGLENLGLDF